MAVETWQVNIPEDCAEGEEAGQLAIMQAEEEAETWVVPALWEARDLGGGDWEVTRTTREVA